MRAHVLFLFLGMLWPETLAFAQSPPLSATSLSADQRGAIADHVRECWIKDAGGPDASQMRVMLTVTTDSNGIARRVEVAGTDADRTSDPAFRAFTERAIRAVLDARCAQLPLPPSALGKNNMLTFRFGVGSMSRPSQAAPSRTWYAITLGGNACENMQQFGQEIMQYGGMPAFSPQNLIDWLRSEGASPTSSIDHLAQGEIEARVSWRSDRGEQLHRTFFSNSQQCKSFVASEIDSGLVPSPDQLR